MLNEADLRCTNRVKNGPSGVPAPSGLTNQRSGELDHSIRLRPSQSSATAGPDQFVQKSCGWRRLT